MTSPWRPELWDEVPGFAFTDITYHRAKDVPAVRIAFNRPEVRNAFRPHTVDELYAALDHARQSADVGCVLLTGNGPSAKDGGWAFCSGGDQRIRGRTGYQYASGTTAESVDPARAGRLHILEVQRLIRFMPKVVIAVVPGWAAGGGHSLHVVADLTLASKEHARFKQTDADVASFDGGFGSAYLARQVGQKFARQILVQTTVPPAPCWRSGADRDILIQIDQHRRMCRCRTQKISKPPGYMGSNRLIDHQSGQRLVHRVAGGGGEMIRPEGNQSLAK